MLTLLLLAATLSSPARMPEILAPEVMVTIAPSSMDEFQLLKRKTPETYTCTLLVRDADTKSAAIGADLVLRPGQSDKVSRVVGEYTLDFSVSMKNQRAETLVTVKRGDKVLTRQRSTVDLRTDQGIIPIR
jgi:hypothetical protein